MNLTAEKMAKDVMKPISDFPHVNCEDDMSEVVKHMYLFQRDICTAVVRSNEIPVGLITARNILEAMEPGAFHISQWSVPVFWDGLWSDQIKNLKNIHAKEIFVPNEMNGVQVDNKLMRVIHSFNRTKMPAIAVMERNNMVGIIEMPQVCIEIMNNNE